MFRVVALSIMTGIIVLAGVSVHSIARADESVSLVVVVNINSSLEEISAREIRKLFMGKSRKLPNGARAILVSFSPASSAFNQLALKRSDSEVTAAWSRLKFSGKTKPPREFSSPDSLMEFVASTPNSIAYLPADVPLQNVRAVHNIR